MGYRDVYLTPRLVGALLAAVLTAQIPLAAATVPAGFAEKLIAGGLASPTAMQFAPDGRMFVAEQSGRLRVVGDNANGANAQSINTLHGKMLRINKDGSIPTDNPVVTFSVQASGAAPLHYQWQRNSSNISGATAQSYSIASVAAGDNGARFRVIVSNDYGSATSNEAVLNGVRQPGAHRDDRPTGQRVDLSRRHDDQLFGNR